MTADETDVKEKAIQARYEALAYSGA